MRKAIIHECGNGFPDVGAHVPGDGYLWRIERITSPIHTGSATGASNYVHAEVSDADWNDCEESEEFPARVELEESCS